MAHLAPSPPPPPSDNDSSVLFQKDGRISACALTRRKRSFAAGEDHKSLNFSAVEIFAFTRRFPCTRAANSVPFGSCSRYVPRGIFSMIWYGPNHLDSNFLGFSCLTRTHWPSSRSCGFTNASRVALDFTA